MHITFKQAFKMVRKFAVVLSQPSQGVFHPGSELEGKLTFELSEPKAYHYINVAIIGEAHVFRDKHQPIHQQYINSQVIVWSKEQAIDGRLQSGPHSFPFQYTLPNCLHSSLLGRRAGGSYSIRYYVEGRIGTGSGKFDHTIRVDFPVVELVDVNLPVLQRPIRSVVQKSIGSWFCASGQIRLTAECPRRGYSIGEGISLKVTLENGSRRQIQILVRLWRIINQFGFGKISILNYLSRSPVPAGRSEILHFEDHLRVPPTIPTVAYCDIIELKYVLQVTAVIPWAINSSVWIPLTIGNVPLRDPRRDVSDPPVLSSWTHPQQGSPSELTTDPPPPYELAYQY